MNPPPDPPKPPSEEFQSVHAAILFVDLIQSTEISVFRGPEYYFRTIREFQRICADVAGRVLLEEGLVPTKDTDPCRFVHQEDGRRCFLRIQGDELLVVLTAPDRGNALGAEWTLVDVLLRVAVRVKREWLLGRDNLQRIRNHQQPFQVGAGIHAGPVMLGTDAAGFVVPEGSNLNLGKRVESESRRAVGSHLVLSESAFQDAQRFRFLSRTDKSHERIGPPRAHFTLDLPFEIELRGITGRVALYPMRCFWEVEGAGSGPEGTGRQDDSITDLLENRVSTDVPDRVTAGLSERCRGLGGEALACLVDLQAAAVWDLNLFLALREAIRSLPSAKVHAERLQFAGQVLMDAVDTIEGPAGCVRRGGMGKRDEGFEQVLKALRGGGEGKRG